MFASYIIFMNEVKFKFDTFTYDFVFDAPTYVDLLSVRMPTELRHEIDPNDPNDQWFMTEHDPDKQVLFIRPKEEKPEAVK
jgi:hypothetical protein